MSTGQASLAEIHSRQIGKLSDKWDLYLQVYDDLLSGYRFKDVSILEIGIQNGGSLETWATYFENATTIVGCDIDEKCTSLRFDDERVHIVIGDAASQNTAEQVDKITRSIDIIIEDGSHVSRDIIASFCNFFPRIRSGGIYIAEDLHCCYWDDWGGGLSNPYSGMEFFKALCDCLNSGHWNRDDIKQTDYINNIVSRFGLQVTDELLQSIQSIEFHDSLCAIKKVSGNRLSRVRERVISGTEETVVEGHKEFSRLMPSCPQKSSTLNGLVDFANHVQILSDKIIELKGDDKSLSGNEIELKDQIMTLSGDLMMLRSENSALTDEHIRLTEANKNLIKDIAAMRTSSSWRLTKPLRAMVTAAKSIIRTNSSQ